MRYTKIICDGYITACGEFQNGISIPNEEYDNILRAFILRPKPPDGYTYKLRADNLEWELVKLPPIPEDEDIPAEEALEILLGGEVE